MILRVYRNLRRSVWSIMHPRTGLLVEHRAELVLLDVRFEVSEATRQRVVRQHRRTVHAYARGLVSDLPVREGGERVHYNPFEAGHFIANGAPIWTASRVDFRTDGAYVNAST